MEKNNSVFANFIWRFLERFGAQGVTVVVSIVLARILDPEVYGTVAIITVFTNILNIFVEGGMGSALIQKKDADLLDFSSVFYFNVFISVICYLAMFFCAPLIADFYNNPDLVLMIRVLSIIVIISGVKNIQQAYVSRNLLFKKFFFSTLGGTIAAAFVGIIMALLGFGVWALIAQYLVNAIIDTAILWLTVKWRPRLECSLTRVKGLFSFGWKMMVSGFIYALFNDFRQLVIGKKYTTADLAYYEKAYTFPRYIVQVVNNSIDSVLFPVMSKSQDDNSALVMLAKKTITISTYLMFPMMAGLFVCADTVVKIVLTEKWLPCVPYLRAFCIVCAFWSFGTANRNVLKAKGKGNILLIVEIVEMVVNFSFLIMAMRYGTFAIAVAWCVSTIVSHIIISIPNMKLIRYGYLAQMRDIVPNLMITLVMSVLVWTVSLMKLNDYLLLLLQVLSGMVIYLVLSVVTKNGAYRQLLNYAKAILQRKQHK